MDKLLIKMKSDRGEEVVRNWSKVKYCDEYGYMACIGKNVYLFVGLDYITSLVNPKGRLNKRTIYKWLTKLVQNDWVYLVRESCNEPFGAEYEPRLPFEIDDTIIELGE